MASSPRAGHYWPSPDQELLLRAAVTRGPDARDAWRRLGPRFDAERVDHASRQLLALLAANRHHCQLSDRVVETLTVIRKQTALCNWVLFRAGRGLLQAFANAGVETLLLKGGALTVGFYRDLGLRPMGDLDVLVPTARAQTAIELLRASDWSSHTRITPEFIQAQHAAHFVAEGDVAHVDLHWHAYWECCQPDADEDLWASSVPLTFQGVPTRMLGPADQLLHVCVHGSRRARRPGLLWIPDALYILRTGGIDWSRLLAQAERRRFVLRAATMLVYLREAFNAPVPDDALAQLLALPVTRLERVEYWVGNRPQGLLGELPSYWCNYRRLRDGSGRASLLGFPRYLQLTWNAVSLGEAARAALARAERRLWAALVGRRAPE